MRGLGLRDLAFLAAAASGFAPPDSSNLVFWGRAGALAGADGASIASFTDLGAVGNHATQATGIFQSTLKLNIVNAQSVLRFDGNDSYAFPNMFGGAATGTIVVVMKSANDPASLAQYCPWFLANGVTGDATHPWTSASAGIQENFGASDVSGIITAPSAANAFHIYAARSRSNEIEMRWNGAVFGGLNKSTAGFTTSPALGINRTGTIWFAGDIAEIFIYKSFLTNAQLQTIHAYLNGRYAIAFTPCTTLATPTTFSGLQNWFKADLLSLNDSDPVSSWADSSGNSNTSTGTTTTRPLFKTNQYNSLPCVRYDGTDDFLIKTNNFASAAGSDITSMFVGKVTKNDSALFGNASGGSQMRARRSGSNQMNFFTGTGGEQLSTGSWRYALGDFNLFVWTRNTGNSTAWYQGPEAYIAGGAGGTFNSAYVGLPAGSGLVFGGDVCEVCEWNTLLSQSDIARLYYDYFKPKWGLP